MASITKYPSKTAKRGHLWRVQYRDPQGKNRSKRGFETKSAAQAWADKNATDVRTGMWLNPTLGRTTVGDLARTWMATQTHLKPSTLSLAQSTMSIHTLPRWEDVPVQSIKPSTVQEWVSGIVGSASTVRRAHAQLAQVLDLAVKDGIMATNPARGVALPRKESSAHVYLTAAQLHLLAQCCTVRGELVMLLGTVGLRWGEAVGLQVQDIDFERRRARIDRNAVWVSSKLHVGTPKTHERRTVAIPGRVLDELRPLCEGRAPDDWLWASGQGLPLRRPPKGGWFSTAVTRAQRADPDFPDITPHGLRHVAAGLMVSAGANVKVVQRQLGHASAVMTLDTYADLFDGDLDEIGEALDRALREIDGM